MKIVRPSVEIIDNIDKDAILKKLEICGRVCYKSEGNIKDDSAEKFVKSIIRRGHESVLEHVSITVRIITDRAIANELTRHRIASYSQESTRYVKYDDIEVIAPVDLDDVSFKAWKEKCENDQWIYKLLLGYGEKPENARAVLPLSLKTELIMTANIREWRHVIKLRSSLAAHPDMRILMNMLYEEFIDKLPPVLFDYVK
ncbi:MAG: FAD-dependent thymidylate synthase [Acidaminobacter sp.]|uniref:FAD-dependent thymidylate synthase n=1 Tax=Acidaminobacter sp. TaxID=1872102 RepID=UPI00137C9AD8|nr:FAD-dependent thymidylate synthase [Acidaminobacter sp.]MZQ97194.1 FAD-dependent thymidylate synthase [Acidaminobacter sp.]